MSDDVKILKLKADTFDSRYVNVVGDTMTGDLIVPKLTATTRVLTPIWAFSDITGVKMTMASSIGTDSLTIETLSGTNTDLRVTFKPKGSGDVDFRHTAEVANFGSLGIPWTNAYIDKIFINSITTSVVSKTGAYTATTDDHIILCNASSASFTVTLPAASGVTGLILHVKKTDSSGNTVTVDGNASETIDGDTTKIISTQYDSMMIICDGSNWHII